MSTKLKIGDKLQINSDGYVDITPRKIYKIVNIVKARRGGLCYVVTHNRKNATREFLISAEWVDSGLKIPTLNDLTSYLGLAFLNFSDYIYYDEQLVKEAKKINKARG